MDRLRELDSALSEPPAGLLETRVGLRSKNSKHNGLFEMISALHSIQEETGAGGRFLDVYSEFPDSLFGFVFAETRRESSCDSEMGSSSFWKVTKMDIDSLEAVAK